MKLLGIAIIRGFDSLDNDVLKAYCLIQYKDGTLTKEEFIADIRRNISKRKLEDEKTKLYQFAMEQLENNKIETSSSFNGIYKDFSEADLRASYPTIEVLEYMLGLKK